MSAGGGMIGRRLAHYEVLEVLGEGGMGVVYRARDLELGRPAAIKVLRGDVVPDPDRRRRFIQEARAASALNHPNIVTIYGLETVAAEDGAIQFIAMELVRGRTLGRLIGPDGLPLHEALRLAVQIADALAAAHGAGIIHRDLKPANVMVTEAGLLKVLDFGLAKLAATNVSDEGPTRSATGIGSGDRIVGTASYMSPEQAEGRTVDTRSDVFSFGTMLYEMLAGRRPFVGEGRVAILSAITKEEPEALGRIRPEVPPALEAIVARCLAKEPSRRFQHMGDVKLALEDVLAEMPSGPSRRGSTTRARGRRWWLVAAGVTALVAAVSAAAWRARRAPVPDRQLVLSRLTWDSGLTTDAAASPAGNLLAYASDRGGEGSLDIWVQPLPRGEAIRLTRHPADDHEPAFSPDGSRIAFRSERDGGGIYVISALGGPEARIADKGRGPRFSPDGRWIAYWVGDTTPLSSGVVYVIPATGGTPRQLGTSALRARLPLWSPESRHVLCLAPTPSGARLMWVALPLDGGPPMATVALETLLGANLMPAGSLAVTPDAWAPDGEHVLFSARFGDSTNVWSIGLSPESWKVTAPPHQVTFATGDIEKPSVAAGRLFFTAASANVDLWSLAFDPASGLARGELRPETSAPGRDDWPSISADGKRVAYLSERSGVRAVWMKDLDSGREAPITGPQEPAAYPRISADGSKVAYLVPASRAVLSAERGAAASAAAVPIGQKGDVFVVSVGRSGEVGVPRRVCAACGRPWDWSADGKYILYRGDAALMLVDADTGALAALAPHAPAPLMDPRVSRDDRWVAFNRQTGPFTREIFVAPFRGREPIAEASWASVTDGKGLDRQVAWAPDGRTLYFHSERDGYRCLWAQRLDEARRPVGASFPIQHFHGVPRSMMTAIGDPGSISIAVGGDRIIFSLGEMTGNIWTTEYQDDL